MSKYSKSEEFEFLLKSEKFLVDYEVVASLQEEGLTQEDFVEICTRLKRAPNRTELGMFGVMWSEHCCYRNSRPLLANFPTQGSRVLVGPGENAGVVDLGEGQRLAFKIESHNHPSALEPFQGAATGVGGILRDIFTMGARPIAVLNALRFGPLEDNHNIALLEGVVAGIAHYGNCVGVPTIGGEVSFDESYSGNPLVNAMALGLMETSEIVCSGAHGVGNSVIYVGSTTGRDGMGGASFASSELTNSSLDDRPAVQVGDPFLEKSLIEACLEVFKSGDVIAAQDMGAAGLTCSCSEMAAKGGVGIEIDLDLVPEREASMTPYEYLLSESQERMLFVVHPDSEEAVIKKFTRWGLRVKVVGKVLKENLVRVLHKNKIVAELPASALADDTPVNKHRLLTNPPDYIKKHWAWNENQLPAINIDGISVLSTNSLLQKLSWNEVTLKLLDNPTIASKQWIYSQYDYQVQNNTIIPPGSADASVIRLRPQESSVGCNLNRGIAAVVDCPNRWTYLDPERGSKAAVVEAARNLSCVGSQPLAVTDNLNFPSPETEVGYWQLAMACRGLSEACQIFETPVTGGNVSLYNETKLSNGTVNPIQPTPVVGMVGLIENLDNVCGLGWMHDTDSIWLLGIPLETSKSYDQRITLSATSYLEFIHGQVTGRPPEIDLQLELTVQKFLRKAIAKGFINSAHDLSDGGLAIALAECCISSDFGANCEIPNSNHRLDRLLFGEGGSRILITVSNDKLSEWEKFIEDNLRQVNDYLINKIGSVQSQQELVIKQNGKVIVNLQADKMKSTFNDSIYNKIHSRHSSSI